DMYNTSMHLIVFHICRMTLIERDDVLDGHKECLMGTLIFFCILILTSMWCHTYFELEGVYNTLH
uniref:Uncharacterized protein n=1 Tax=Aegilops tauschii subsp. strangulata TaxID=200361 RepID=A0A452YSA0_AEGTS